MPKRSKPRAEKKARANASTRGGFGHGVIPLRVALYARVSSDRQQTIPMQLRALREHAKRRRWTVVIVAEEKLSTRGTRPKRELLMQAARRRDVDAILVWKLDRWGRSVADLVGSLAELVELGVAFVSLTEALDLTTPTGRAMAGMLAVFAEFERDIRHERVMAGIAQARRDGRHLGRPKSASLKAPQVRKLYAKKLSQAEIARRLSIGRATVRRILAA